MASYRSRTGRGQAGSSSRIIHGPMALKRGFGSDQNERPDHSFTASALAGAVFVSSRLRVSFLSDRTHFGPDTVFAVNVLFGIGFYHNGFGESILSKKSGAFPAF